MESLSENYLRQLLQKCLDAVGQLAGEASVKSVEKYLTDLGYLGIRSTLPNAVFHILDMKTLTFKFVANTEEALGISPEELLQKGMPLVFKTMATHSQNINAVPELLKFMFDAIKDAPRNLRESFICYGYGVQYYRPSKKIFHSLVQVIGLEFDENGLPTLCFVIDQDVEHLVKKLDHFWGRISFGKGKRIVTYSSIEKQTKIQDIFTDREEDVLKLLLKGNESKQIADKLFISHNTVDNHRKNMIRKLDARDTTALVQLSKLLGILK